MADTITVTYKVKEDGSLEKITKKAKGAADATDKLNNKKNRYNRQEKGAAQLTSNSTKAFSKQAQTVGGTLVPAYATLAANVFAITAAFGVLQRSGGIQKLEEGLNFTGRAAGQNLPYIADRLREITGAAVSTADAMKSVAVGISAGFSQGQMEGLTKVAKGASLALGRDMTDAMDRLTRGAAKLEPEILDELGILVRLDEVSQDYAASVGKSVDELSSFEKRMAFTNAIIDQGTKKFGNLAKAVDENPYNKLAASFADLSQTLIQGLSVALNPIVSLLASSPMALVGVLVLFGSTILKQLVPAVDIVIGRQKVLANAAAVSAQKASKVISKEYTKAVASVSKAFKTVPPSVKKMEKEIKAGTLSTKQLKTAINNLAKSEKLRSAANNKAGNALSAQKKRELLEIKALQTEMLKLQAIEGNRAVASGAGIRASGKSTASGLTGRGLNEINNSATVMGGFGKAAKYSGLQMANLGKTTGIFNKIVVGFRAATGAVTLFGTAALNAIPILGQILFFGSLLYPLFKKFFSTPTTLVSETMEGITERMEELNNVTAQMATTYLDATTNADRFFTVLNASTGVTQQINDSLFELVQVQQASKVSKLIEARKKLYATQTTQAKVAKGEQESELGFFKTWMLRMASAELMRAGALQQATEMLELTKEGAYEAQQVAEAEKELASVQNASAISTLETKEGMVEILSRELATYETMKTVVFENTEEVELLNTKIKATAGFLRDLEKGMSPEEVLKNFRTYNIEQQNISASAKAAEQHVANLVGVFAKGAKATGEFSVFTNDLSAALKDMAGGIDFDAIIEKYGQIFKLFGLSEGDVAGLTRVNNELKLLDARTAGMEMTKSTHALTAGAYEIAGLEVAASQTRQSSLNAEILLAQAKARSYQSLGLSLQASQEEAKVEGLKLNLIKEQEKERQKRVDNATRISGAQMGASMDASSSIQANASLYASSEVSTSEKFKMMGESMKGMMDQAKQLGPEGELIAAVSAGAFTMAEAMSTAFDQIKEKEFGLAEGLQLASAGVAALGQMQQAKAKAAVAGIDKEIAAEKKRDGKSAGSLAKIAAMEKKKDAIKRKAFEQNKKMQMAQIVMSTASAIMSAIQGPPGLPWSAVFGGMAAAMGAAQLSAIASTSYQGGASAGAPSMPSKISVGNRQNSVDMAKARSPSGELAYARGSSGTGQGMTNFRPTGAFSGYKHRAGGGYIVGEQGPELFMPDVPGEIVSSGQEMGGATNVTFNINAVDAAGVEDLLLTQRGNIIGMIRESANAHGENFLENVNTMADNRSV